MLRKDNHLMKTISFNFLELSFLIKFVSYKFVSIQYIDATVLNCVVMLMIFIYH